MEVLHHQRQDICGNHKGQQRHSNNEKDLTHRDLWHWLIDQSVLTNYIDVYPINVLLYVCKGKNLCVC